jgi:hypothetical protein
MSLVSNANNVAFASAYDVDKIVGVYEGSFDMAADVTKLTADWGDIYVYRIPHGLTRPVFVDLIWKTGGSWYDGGNDHLAYSDSTYINIISSTFAPAVGTMYYKVIATWINEFDSTNPLVAAYQSTTKSKNFDSRANYQKIYKQNVLNFTADGTQSVAHDLNRKANFRVFYEALPNQVWPAFSGGVSNPYLYDSSMTECEPYITTTVLNVELITVTPTRRAWYKIYLDS